jgi:hypothetical protein
MKQGGKDIDVADSVETQDFIGSPNPNLRTDVSHSTAQNTLGRPNQSINDTNINGGPSVGLEDSKFLNDSSMVHG